MSGYDKTQALKAIEALGYTNHFDTGSCGDSGYGSRLYFKAPDGPINEYGLPTDKYGTLSRVGSSWYLSDFKKETL